MITVLGIVFFLLLAGVLGFFALRSRDGRNDSPSAKNESSRPAAPAPPVQRAVGRD